MAKATKKSTPKRQSATPAPAQAPADEDLPAPFNDPTCFKPIYDPDGRATGFELLPDEAARVRAALEEQKRHRKIMDRHQAIRDGLIPHRGSRT